MEPHIYKVVRGEGNQQRRQKAAREEAGKRGEKNCLSEEAVISWSSRKRTEH